MAQDIVSAPLGEVRVASTANGGTSLTTTSSFISMYRGTNLLRLSPRNAVTAVVIKWALCPWLEVIKTTDALVAASNLTEASQVLQDNDVASNLDLLMNSFSTAASGAFLYIGSHIPFRGVRVTIGNTNSNASVITVKYWNGTAWTDITATDGTANAGASFGQTGNVTWTVPTAWAPTSLVASLDTLLQSPAQLADPQLYWTRWQFSLAFDASVSIAALQSMYRSTTYDELDIALTEELRVNVGSKGVSCVEALTDAGTASLIVRCAAVGVGSKFIFGTLV